MTIKQLERAVRDAHKETMRLQDQLDEIREKRALPKLKKQFEGKYFKYNNGFNNDIRWPVYSYCHEVIGESEAIVDQFQLTPEGEWQFKYRGTTDLFMLAQIVT